MVSYGMDTEELYILTQIAISILSIVYDMDGHKHKYKNKTENIKVHAHVDIKIREITDRNCTCEWINRRMMNEWMDKQISRWMDGWMD